MLSSVSTASADLEGGVGDQIRGLGDGRPPVGSRGEAPARGLGDGVRQKLEHFFKYTAWHLRPCENERHNLMSLMSFFIAVHTSIVLFQCHVAKCLASCGVMTSLTSPLTPPLSASTIAYRQTDRQMIKVHDCYTISVCQSRCV